MSDQSYELAAIIDVLRDINKELRALEQSVTASSTRETYITLSVYPAGYRVVALSAIVALTYNGDFFELELKGVNEPVRVRSDEAASLLDIFDVLGSTTDIRLQPCD